MKLAKLIVATLAISITSAPYAQVPVTVTSDIPSIINQIETMAQWGKQYGQMVSQLKQMKSQYESMTGSRGLGMILNNPALRSHLPDHWAGIYDKVKSGRLTGISSRTTAIFSEEGFDTAVTGGRRRQLDVMAANKAMGMQAYDATLTRLANINSLMEKANETNDIKAAADLQNRMAAENAAIQNEQTRLNLLTELQKAEMQLATEQRLREFKRGYLQ